MEQHHISRSTSKTGVASLSPSGLLGRKPNLKPWDKKKLIHFQFRCLPNFAEKENHQNGEKDATKNDFLVPPIQNWNCKENENASGSNFFFALLIFWVSLKNNFFWFLGTKKNKLVAKLFEKCRRWRKATSSFQLFNTSWAEESSCLNWCTDRDWRILSILNNLPIVLFLLIDATLKGPSDGSSLQHLG